MTSQQKLHSRLLGTLSGLLLAIPNIYPVFAFSQLVAFLPILYLVAVDKVNSRYMLVAGLYMGIAYIVPQLIILRMPPIVALILFVYLIAVLMFITWGTKKLFARATLAGCFAFGSFLVIIDWLNVTAVPFWGTAQSFVRGWSRYPGLISFSSFTGMAGIIFALVVLQSLFFTSVVNRKLRRVSAVTLILFVSLLFVANKISVGQKSFDKIKVAAVGWSLDDYQDLGSQKGVEFLFTEGIVQAAKQGAELIVFPETVFSLNDYNDSIVLSLSQLAQSHKMYLAAGYFDNVTRENKMLFMDCAGEVICDYAKTHLTLFEKDFKNGNGQIKTVDCNGICLGGMICHDDNFTRLSRSYGRNATGIVAVPTLDWTNVKNAHFQSSIHRAIESRYGIVRAACNGISAIISPAGHVLAKKDHLTQGPGLIIAEMPVYKSRTFYSIAGNWFVVVCLVYMGVYIFQIKRKSFNNWLSEKWLVITIIWVARIFASLLAALVLMFAIGQGVPNPFKLPLLEVVLFFAMLVMFIGCLLGWKWPGLGGLLIVAGILFFHVVERRLFLSGAFPLFDLAGILYLLSWFSKMMQKTETQTEILKEF